MRYSGLDCKAQPPNDAGPPQLLWRGAVPVVAYLPSMNLHDIISIDPAVLSGQPVFAGTRVPISTLFDHLEAGVPLAEFLDDFPSVSKEQAVALLDAANRLLTAKNLEQLYAAVA